MTIAGNCGFGREFAEFGFVRRGDSCDVRRGAAERAIRPLAIGRSNWLHVGGDGGLKTASVLLSVCASATCHALNPWSYLRDVLDQLAARSAGDDVGCLLPDAWASRHARTT